MRLIDLGGLPLVTAALTMSWDAKNGIYAGAKAKTPSTFELPSPLWIFGYASLVWKPDPGWELYENKPGVLKGWCRVFAQRSMDHRGTPEAPGLVCTMIPENVFRAENLAKEEETPNFATAGTAYLVPETDVTKVLETLDFREKGGYTRQVATVSLHDGSTIQALVYTGTTDNPNFSRDLASTSEAALEKASQIIATSEGPSGQNKEYLFNLAAACPDDPYLQALTTRVHTILGHHLN